MHTFSELHIALIPIFRTEFGLDFLAIGLMVSLPLLIQALLAIPAGLLADRIDRSRMITIGLIVTGINGILLSQVNSALMLILLTSLLSISSCFIHPPALSAVGDTVSNTTRGRALGFFGAAGTFGISLGPITLSFLLAITGWRFVYLMWSIPALLLPALIMRLKFERLGESRDSVSPRKSSKFAIFMNLSLLLLLAVMAARAMSGTVVNTYITSYFADNWMLSPATASLVFGLRPLMGIVAAPIGGILVDKVGEKKGIAFDLAVEIVGILVVAYASNVTGLILGYVVYGFFGNMEMPAVQSLMVKLTPAEGRGLAFSISFLPGTLAGAASPVLGALIVGAFGIWQIFPFSLAMLIVAMFLLSFLKSRR
jgi:MFS family permease